MNALENWFKEILSGAIEGCLNTVNDMLSGALNNNDNTGLNGIFSQFLGDPTTFTGTTGSGGTSIWTTIEKLSNDVIVPIGAFMLMIVVCYELFSMVVEGNNFRDFDDSIFYSLDIKIVLRNITRKQCLLHSNRYFRFRHGCRQFGA